LGEGFTVFLFGVALPGFGPPAVSPFFIEGRLGFLSPLTFLTKSPEGLCRFYDELFRHGRRSALRLLGVEKNEEGSCGGELEIKPRTGFGKESPIAAFKPTWPRKCNQPGVSSPQRALLPNPAQLYWEAVSNFK
jgi:hypothetical protein